MNAFGRTAAAVVVAAGLFGYIYFVESGKEPKTAGSESDSRREKVFPGLDKLKVKSITLTKRSGENVRAEKTGDAWFVVSPLQASADSSEIATLLEAMQNLESEEILDENAPDLSPYGLAAPKVAVSLVADGSPKPFEFELGDAVPAGSGLFARVPGQPRVYVVSSTLENTLGKSAFDLRDRALFKVKKDAVQSVEATENGRPLFRLVRGSKGEDDWKVSAPVATRAARWTVDSFLGLIENLRMESIVTEAATAADLTKYGLTGTARRVALDLGESNPVTLEIGKKSEDGKYYARAASSRLIATISSGVVDDLDKGLKNLRVNRLLDVAAYEVTGFDVVAGGATRTFTKATTKGKDGVDVVEWKGGPPAKNVTQEKASDALFAIGGLDAAEFIDAPKALSNYGLDAPALRVTLRFDGDKKEDWFEVAIKGAEAFARRRDDAAVIKLDKAKTEDLIKNFTSLGA